MSTTVAAVEKDLRQFAQTLVPKPEYLKRASEAVETIVNLLRGKSEVGIDRLYTCGSVGKKTSVITSDSDVVLFVNIDKIDEVKGVLANWLKILKEAKLPKELSKVKTTDYSLQFTYDGIEMDFLPAINLVQGEPNKNQPGNPKLGALQALATLKEIKANRNKIYHYSSALAESVLRFMKDQSSNIHELVRICKNWNNSLPIQEYISGRSTLIELIAVSAGQQEENESKKNGQGFSLFRGFKTFLEQMEKFPQLNISNYGFDPLKGSGGTIAQLIQGGELAAKNGQPVVLEPANPYNNIALGVEANEMKMFQEFAKKSLGRLVAKSSTNPGLSLDTIFDPK